MMKMFERSDRSDRPPQSAGQGRGTTTGRCQTFDNNLPVGSQINITEERRAAKNGR
jgi:hypothetical protein